ncbi:MAG: hypothetical protein A9Z00_12055 [Thermobacillus sp. ZCTH02-B1]|nr:MAG: hypothetical protein A9Z00_12055 [Thermobacillus sp. ZCTH02-B1]
MSVVHGASVQKPEPFPVETERIEPLVPVKSKMSSESGKVAGRSEGPLGERLLEGKRTFRFDQITEQDKQKLQEELDRHNAEFAYTGKYLKFKFDEEASMLYVEVIDASTHEVIVSLPPEFLIDLSIKMKKILGLYIDERL